MLRLAERKGVWLLVKCGAEYWYVLPDLSVNCVNVQSESYGAMDALAFVESRLGKASRVRLTIKSC